MMNEKQAPSSVLALAQKVGMTPLDWAEYPDRIVIIFVEGPKMTFEREEVTTDPVSPETAIVTGAEEPAPTPAAAENTPPTDERGNAPARLKKKGR